MAAQPCNASVIPDFVLSLKLTEGTLCPIIQVTDENVKQYWSQYQPLGYICLQVDFILLITTPEVCILVSL